jgi:hypothetical protein
MRENSASAQETPEKLGYASTPMQTPKRIYHYNDALKTGTLFPSLKYDKGEYGYKENFS